MNSDKTFCVFGDSITQAAYIETSWVDLLRQFLEKKLNRGFINVFNLGIGGNTTDDVVRRFNFEASMRMPTDIIFSVGVNDSGYFKTLDKEIVPMSRFENNLSILIEEARKFTKNIFFIGLVLGDDSLLKPFPGSSKGKSYDEERVAMYNLKLREIASKNSCKFIEISNILKPEDFSDGLHPNDNGHRKIFEEIKKIF